MAKSLENIKAINKNIKLFGTKTFESQSSKWYDTVDIDDWSSEIFDDSEAGKYAINSKINDDLRNIAESLSVEFVNTQHLICGGKDFCSNYVDGNIISYDASGNPVAVATGSSGQVANTHKLKQASKQLEKVCLE